MEISAKHDPDALRIIIIIISIIIIIQAHKPKAYLISLQYQICI